MFLKAASSVFLVLLALLTAKPVAAQYCSPSYTDGCLYGDEIVYVQLNTINKSTAGCTSAFPAFLSNFTGTDWTFLTKGFSYNLTAGAGPQYDQYIGVWIDWNQDKDWQDAGEFTNLFQVPAGDCVTVAINVPAGALNGSTRMRVLCDYSNILSQSGDCISTTYGEAEDYTVVVFPQQQIDAAITKLISPVTACGLDSSETISAEIWNPGIDTIFTFQACYEVNGGGSVCESVNAMILPGAKYNHSWTQAANLSAIGFHNISCWVVLAGDTLAINDSLLNKQVENIPVISTIPYFDDFESGSGGWVAGGSFSTWSFGIPQATFIPSASSTDNAWVTNLTGNYNDNEQSTLTSPCMNFSSLVADPTVAFAHIFATEQCCDYGWAEISTDAGQTWSKLGTASSGGYFWYNDSLNDVWNDYSGAAGKWNVARHKLTGTAGKSSVKFRFVLTADGSITEEGFGVDDFLIADTIVDGVADNLISPVSGCGLGAADSVMVKFKNTGTTSIQNFPACFSFNGAPVVCETFNGTIVPGDSAIFTFTQTINLSALGTYSLDIWLSVPQDLFAGNDTLYENIVHVSTISSFPYSENFENGSPDWNPGGIKSTWSFGTPAKTTIQGAASGDSAWVTGGPGTGTYLDDEASYVIGPCFDFSLLNDPWIKLSAWWESESFYDGAAIQASTDGGNAWFGIGMAGDPVNWYNHPTVVGLTNYGYYNGGWSGDIASSFGSGTWVTAQHKLDSLAGKSSVFIRVFFATDASVTMDGFAFDDILITNGPPPSVYLGPDTSACGPYVINPNKSGGTFNWSNGATSSTLSVSASGLYILEYEDSTGLSAWDTVNISIVNNPVNLGSDDTICDNEILILDAGTGNISYAWSTGASTQTIAVNTAGSFAVDVNDGNGCFSSDTIVVSVLVAPVAMIGSDSIVCPGDTVCIGNSLPAGLAYSWNTGSASKVICPTSAGIYIVSISDLQGCSDHDTMSIFNWANSTVNLGPDQSICPGDSVCLIAGLPFNTYNWSNGGTGESECFYTADTVSVISINSKGCIAKDTIGIFSGIIPQVNLNDTTGCSGGSICLTAGPVANFTYLWSSGQTTATVCLPNGSYEVTVTSSDGCETSDSVTIMGILAPLASFSFDTTGCPLIVFTDLSSGIVTNRNWDFGDGGTGTMAIDVHDYTSAGNGTYNVNLVVANSCGPDTFTQTVVINCVIGMGDSGFPGNILMYPNPAGDVFFVELEMNTPGVVSVAVRDIHGREIYSGESEKPLVKWKKAITSEQMSAGIYIVTIRAGGIRHARKLVVE